MKLIIQIPCFNEESIILETLKDLPKKIQGVTCIEYLIIDDGSNDKTVDVAKKFGVKHIVQHNYNQGLAKAFMSGIHYSIKNGADIIVNTDADNQYKACFIKDLVKPIIENNADIVIGTRPISKIKHFSFIKKCLQKFGSFFVRVLSNTDVQDAPSGFRAFSRSAAEELIVFNEYTYTLETIIQAGHKNIKIVSCPIDINGETRPSKLVKNIFSYVKKSAITMIRIYVIYKPFRFFIYLALFFLFFGLIICFRFLYLFIIGEGAGHIQSLQLGTLLILIGFINVLFAFMSDLIAANRKLLEEIRNKINRY
jgi:glycosyltransferase involved in cell wall biosynthesis